MRKLLPPKNVLKNMHCWLNIDRVPHDTESTEWKRFARWLQAKWREEQGYPVGSQPYNGGLGSYPVGSRIELEFARSSGVNFITPSALSAVRVRLANPELHQMLSEERLWADALSSMPLCFNLFGDLAADPECATEALRAWWPDTPHGKVIVRFEHSPGRRNVLFLGNRSAFDVAFEIEIGAGQCGIIGVETKYQEHTKIEPPPNTHALARYTVITECSMAFFSDWRNRVVGTELQQIWLDHLLVLSMLQHPSGRWSWGRFILVYPEGNSSFARAANSYREVLKDKSTFEPRTIEDLIQTSNALDPTTAFALQRRYLGNGSTTQCWN